MVVEEDQGTDMGLDQGKGYYSTKDIELNTLENRQVEVEALPPLTKRRISALKKILNDYLIEEAKHEQEIYKLSCQLQRKLHFLYEKRNAIINGTFTPNDDDLFPEEINMRESDANDNFEDNGIPGFWLTVLKSNTITGGLVQLHDEPALNHLIDIKLVMIDSEPMGFKLEFYFSKNEYFSNSVLTKTYSINFNLDEEDPLSYENPDIYKCEGCTIDWFPDKNLTFKLIKKRQKHRGSNLTRIVSKPVKIVSFFNFFEPPLPEEHNDELQEDLEDDYEVGHFIKEKLIPRAILYFTGEADESDTSSDSEDDEGSSTEESQLSDEISQTEDIDEQQINQPN